MNEESDLPNEGSGEICRNLYTATRALDKRSNDSNKGIRQQLKKTALMNRTGYDEILMKGFKGISKKNELPEELGIYSNNNLNRNGSPLGKGLKLKQPTPGDYSVITSESLQKLNA
jgi:hypothetical protein